MPKRTDANHAAIIKVLRGLGCSVHSTHTLGKGFPDLVVGVSGTNLLVEVKDSKQPPNKRRLTADEAKWHQAWKGAPVLIIESEAQAVDMVRNVRMWTWGK